MSVRAVVFDFNGTLSDDEPILLRDLSASCSPSTGGRSPSTSTTTSSRASPRRRSSAAGSAGSTTSSIAEQDRALPRAVSRRRTVVPRGARRRPLRGRAGAGRDRLRRAAREEIEPVVAAAGLAACVAAIVAADHVDDGKPDPEGYLRAARAARGVAPHEIARLRGHRGGRRVGQGRRAASSSASPARSAPSGSPRRTSWSTRIDLAAAAARAAVTLVIAHRGASWELPENTLPAFERAIELGRRLRRVRRPRRPRRQPRRRPRPAAAPGSAYPTLEEVLDLCRGRIGVMVELKRPCRYRRHDVVARTLAAARRRRRRPLLPARARSRSRAASGPRSARCSTSATASRSGARAGAWAAGFANARVTRARPRGAQPARPRDGGLHGERAGAHARAGSSSASAASSLTVRILR